ncbi:MAG: hypothetical protein H6739_26375 [Alphaproteobacteria bacterium]|nr:hypothetical protein [Alphaproteobacteria bacterium]
MSLTLLMLLAPAWAGGSLLRLDVEADPTLRPDLRDTPLERAFPTRDFSMADTQALARLDAELEAVRPLADEFDGELQIMSRLDAVISDISVVRDEADRDLLRRALLFQGFAVQRYFQDQLADDPAAAPYRVEMNGQVLVKPWVDAVALDPDHTLDADEIPGQDELRAFDEARAQVRLAPKATIHAADLPPGAALVVDGRAPDPGPRVYVPPGQHRIAVVQDGVILARQAARLSSGAELEVEVPAMAADLMGMTALLATQPPNAVLPEGVPDRLAALEQPVVLAVQGKKDVLLYEVSGSDVMLLGAPAGDGPDEPWLNLHARVGGGWVYDGNWFLAQPGAAPYERSTVNAGAPVLGVALSARRGMLAGAAGVDLLLPLGAWHAVPSGDGEVRLRTHPYVAVGVPWVQATGGFLFPWHPTVGLRATVPVGRIIEISGAALYGVPVALDRGEEPAFEADRTLAAWLSVGTRFGLR